MKTALILVTIAAASLTACKSSSAPGGSAKPPSDAVEQRLQEIAGSRATNCGRVKSQAPEQIKPASDCALQASQKKQPFYVAYEMPGLTVAVAGNAEGKLFSVSSEQPENAQPGTKSEAKSVACPAELRVAQSGRVTCMPPGSAMSTGGASHGGMPMPSPGGENPHAGAISTTPGAPNPHAGTTPKPPDKKQ